MQNSIAMSSSAATLATVRPDRSQWRTASVLCGLAALTTACLLPIADWAGPAAPGFLLVNQTALIVAYALSSWVLFGQSRRDRSRPLLLAAGGTLFTATVVFFQLLSFPGILATGRILGGAETATWLWTFWHVGPPGWAIVYAVVRNRARPDAPTADRTGWAVTWTALAALLVAAAAGLLSTVGLAWLPHQVSGNDYGAMVTSGIGPAVEVLTVVALIAIWRATRKRRTMLELWIAVSVALLVFDNLLTLAGGARGSIGWYVGRIEALASAFSILWAYLHEVDSLRGRAEAATEELVRTGAALRQAQKMEAVGRLTGGIAHDFNNLLMVVTSGFEMIRRRPEDHARVVRMADAGLAAAQRGARLTSQLLTFARRQNLRPETVNPNASLMEFEPLARRATGESIGLEFVLYPALHPAQIDRSEFEAAVLNLVVNARDAVRQQTGRITVATRNAIRQTNPQADEPGAADFVVISVTDNGVGMDEAIRAQAFEPFFTTKEFGKGSGLGLSQVHGFAHAMGGTVEIASQAGKGTTVEIWLPRADVVPRAETQDLRPASALRRAEHGETVVAVEDDPGVLAAIVENLADLGYNVIPARDAAEALERLQSPERVDILFSDIVMPGGMNGVQLAVEAVRLRPHLRVLLTSGYTNEALVGEHRVPPDVPILTKPYRREELAERLKIVRRNAA